MHLNEVILCPCLLLSAFLPVNTSTLHPTMSYLNVNGQETAKKETLTQCCFVEC